MSSPRDEDLLQLDFDLLFGIEGPTILLDDRAPEEQNQNDHHENETGLDRGVLQTPIGDTQESPLLNLSIELFHMICHLAMDPQESTIYVVANQDLYLRPGAFAAPIIARVCKPMRHFVFSYWPVETMRIAVFKAHHQRVRGCQAGISSAAAWNMVDRYERLHHSGHIKEETLESIITLPMYFREGFDTYRLQEMGTVDSVFHLYRPHNEYGTAQSFLLMLTDDTPAVKAMFLRIHLDYIKELCARGKYKNLPKWRRGTLDCITIGRGMCGWKEVMFRD